MGNDFDCFVHPIYCFVSEFLYQIGIVQINLFYIQLQSVSSSFNTILLKCFSHKILVYSLIYTV